MISAEFSRTRDGLSLKMDGHVGYAQGGAEIVCAAVSGIFYALIGYMANECEGLAIKTISPGHAFIECGMDGEEAMKQACIGFLQIALTYPGTLKVDNCVWNWKISKPA